MRSLLLGTSLWILLSGHAAAGDNTVLRYVEFRDGSVLQLAVEDEEWKISSLGAEGRIEEKKLKLSSLEFVRLTPERVFDKKRAILAAVQKMGSDEFAEREQGQEELLKMGPGIRADLEVALELFSDLEIQDRLKKILARWPQKLGAPHPNPPPPVGGGQGVGGFLDVIGGKDQVWADVGIDGIAVRVGDATRRLTRRQIVGMTIRPPTLGDLNGDRRGLGALRRITDKQFPPGCIEEPFDTTPEGRKLIVGENIEKLFVKKGFVLSTSITTSFVSVNDFKVEGKSGGLSAATHQPLYHGEITIRFVQPGRENVPAGVTHFGCWLAIVMPKGTALVAYDFQGRELGKVHTEQGPHEFVGLHSTVPMHRIKIVPNLQIDPDYTMDDFIFTAPQPIEVRHPEKYIATLNSGERILCSAAAINAESIVLRGLPADLPDQVRPLAELVRITTPTRGKPERDPPVGLFAELADGSVIYGALAPKDKPGTPVFARRPGVLQQTDSLISLRRSDFPGAAWPIPGNDALLWEAARKRWVKVSGVKWTDSGVQWSAEGAKVKVLPYRDISALVLKKQAAPPKPGSWRLRTTQGEEIVPDGEDRANLSGALAKEISAHWQGQPLKISAEELVSISRVPLSK